VDVPWWFAFSPGGHAAEGREVVQRTARTAEKIVVTIAATASRALHFTALNQAT
jgi:hypothetical protein